MSKPVMNIENIWTYMDNLTPEMEKDLYDYLSFTVPGARFAIMNKPNWDGKKRLFQKRYSRFLTGLDFKVAVRLKEQFGIAVKVNWKTERPEKNINLKWNDDFILRDYQKDLVSTLISKGRGILCACTGAGKTLIVAKTIQEISVAPFIFYVLTRDLMYQSKKVLENAIPGLEVGLIGDGICDIKDINVVTVQTAITAFSSSDELEKERKSIKEFSEMEDAEYKEWKKEDLSHVQKRKDDIVNLVTKAKGIYFDEAHHCSAETCKKILTQSPESYYRFGGSATPERADNSYLIIEGLFGRQTATVTASDLIKKGYLMKPNIRFIKLETKKKIVNTFAEDRTIHIVENIERNDCIVKLAKDLQKKKISTLILVQIIEHGNMLKKLIPNSEFVHGSTPKEKRSELLRKLANGEITTLIGSSLDYREKILIRNDDTGEIKNIAIGDFTTMFMGENKTGSYKLNKNYSSLSLNKFNKLAEFKKITHVHRKDKEVPMIEVNTNKNFECLVTDNHSLITTENGKDLIEYYPNKENKDCIVPLDFNDIYKNRIIINEIDLLDEIVILEKTNKYTFFSLELSQSKIRKFKNWKNVMNNIYPKERRTLLRITEELKNNGFMNDEGITNDGLLFLTNFDNIMNYKYKCLKNEHRYYYDPKVLYKNEFIKNFLKISICAKKSRDKFYYKYKITKDFCEFLGYYSSEGYMDKNINSSKNQTRIILSSCINNEIDTKKTSEHMSFCLEKLNIKYNYNDNDKQFIINNSTFFNLLCDVFDVGIGFYEKKIPRFIFNQEKSNIDAYMFGLLMGDGSIKVPDKTIQLCTSSFHLSRDFIYLCRVIGCKNITVLKREPSEKNKNTTNGYVIRILENYKLDENNKSIEFYPSKRIRYEEYFNNINTLEKIKKCNNYIENHNYVYDVSVEENENFFCGIGPICAHNTIADEGLDVPTLSALILAGGGKSSIKAKQRVGRVIRLGSPYAYVFDFHDVGKHTKRHSESRIRILEQEPEFEVKTIPSSYILKKDIQLF